MIVFLALGIATLSNRPVADPAVSLLFQQPHFYYAMVVSQPKAYAFHARRHKANVLRVAARRRTERVAAVSKLVKSKVTRVATLTKPRPQITESIAMTFKDAANQPVDGANVQVDLYDSNNTLLVSKVYKTGEGKPGVIWVKAPKLPAVVKAEVVTGEPWEIDDPQSSVFTLSGKEGDVMSNTGNAVDRRLQASIALSHPYMEYDVKTEPQTSVFWGDEKVADAGADGIAHVKLPKATGDNDVSLYLQKSSGSLTYDSEISTANASPNSPTEVTAKPLSLESISDVQIQDYPDDSGGMIKGQEITSTYGKHRKEKQDKTEKADRLKWWDFPQKGLSFRMHKVRSENGKEEELVERIRITSAEGGKIGPIQVGTSAEELETLLGPGTQSATDAADQVTSYLDGGLLVHKGSNSVDWIEVCRPIALLKSGVMMAPTTGRSRIYIEVQAPEAGLGDQIRSKFANLPGLEIVNQTSDADLVVKVNLEPLTHKQASFLGAVPMLYSTECKLTYTITDTLTGAAAKGVDGGVVETPPVDVTSRADYEFDVEAGAALMGIGGVAATRIQNPAERKIILALIGGQVVPAIARMKATMNRAIPRTNDLAIAEAAEPILRSLETATLFRARVSNLSLENQTVTLNVGSSNGVHNGMEFVIFNENVGAFPNSIDEERAVAGPHVVHSLKEDYVIARVTDAQADHCECKLFQIKHSVSKKAYEQTAEKPVEDGIAKILDPSTGLVNARIILRTAPPVTEKTEPEPEKGG